MNPLFLLLSIFPLLLSLLPHVASFPPHVPDPSPTIGLSIDLVGSHGKYYTANLTLDAEMPMEMRMLVDSSSSDMWFASDWCEGPVSECGSRRYNCTRDDMCEATDPKDYKTKYGTKEMDICYEHPLGCIKATVAHVWVGLKGKNIQVFAWTIGMLNSSTGIFGEDPQFDGLMGLGRADNLEVVHNWFPEQPKMTMFQNLLHLSELKTEFSVYLRQGWGKLDLGYSVPAHYKPPLNIFPGASSNFWILLADNIHLGEFEWWNQPCEFNTGSPNIGIPDRYFTKVLQSLEAKIDPESGTYLVKCPDKITRYPSFQFTFYGVPYKLEDTMFVNPNPIRPGYCQLLFAPSHRPYWILGIPWFEKYYTRFSFDQNTIGLAEAK
eukprot:Sdes_comp19857_c0_seq1m12102